MMVAGEASPVVAAGLGAGVEHAKVLTSRSDAVVNRRMGRFYHDRERRRARRGHILPPYARAGRDSRHDARAAIGNRHARARITSKVLDDARVRSGLGSGDTQPRGRSVWCPALDPGVGSRVHMTGPTLQEWLREEPFALTMSAGFFGFFAHAGMLTILEDVGLVPTRLSGASAGALVAGAWASGLDASALTGELLRLQRKDFWDPRPGAGFLRGDLFRSHLASILPAKNFGQCRVPLAMSTYDVLQRRVRVLDTGELAPAISASCAVPLMFHPVRVGGRILVDGGVVDRPGLAGMRDGRLLFHHLASRSPWRRPGSPSMEIPSRVGMTTVVVEALPRVGPFRLAQGVRAFDAARRGMKRALGQPIERDVVRV